MSNRLSFAHTAPRREPHEWMPAPARSSGIAATALRWLREVAPTDQADMPAAMARDLGLPEAATTNVAFACAVEQSRLRL
jgi:hypothetical protein